MRLNLLIILCLSFVTTAMSQNNFAESDFVEVDCNATSTTLVTSTMLSTTKSTTEKRISSSSTTSAPKVLPQISPNCKVAGEGKGNNPEYCYAIYEEKVLGNDGMELDCCWTANVESKLPKHLEGIAKIFENNTMYYY